MRSVLVFALLLLSPLAASAGWQSLQQEARGQTVWFNAWGGDPAVNRYLDWVSGEVKRDYAIDLRIVHIADAADAVKRIQTEARAGRSKGGSIDLLWVNGENFSTLKNARLLQTRWAETLPNWRFVDTQKPVREDFSIPTDGAESPWGGAQLTFIARRSQTPDGPTTPQALLAFAAGHPGSVTYPRPPDFTGTAFLEQLLLTLTPRPDALRQPPEEATFAAVTAPLWHYLDRLHPLLWRQGRDFPASPARMDAMLKNGTLRLSITFNPLHAKQKAVSGELPKDSYGFGFREGMLGNVHFVAIPANARATAGAKVVANFLLSPQAQLRKADPTVWGDPSVLDPAKLTETERQAINAVVPQNMPPMLGEPHAAWVDALEQEWLRRYGSTKAAGLGRRRADLSAAAAGRCADGASGAPPRPLAVAVCRPAIQPGAGGNSRLNPAIGWRRTDHHAHRRGRTLAVGRLAAAGRKAPSAAGGAPRGLRHRSPAALRRWRLALAPVALFYPAG